MHTILLTLLTVFGLTCAASSTPASHATSAAGAPAPTATSCPSGSERGLSMVENFLTKPEGAGARGETGTSGLSTSQIEAVQNQSVCQTLDETYATSEFADYNVTYYEAGDFYFVVAILEQPEDPNRVRFGISFIWVYNEDVDLIAGYGG